MSNMLKPNLVRGINLGKPQLSKIENFIKKPIKKSPLKADINRETTKTGDFICIFIILGFICYFIFWGKSSTKKESKTVKNKLEQIEKLNYSYFNSTN